MGAARRPLTGAGWTGSMAAIRPMLATPAEPGEVPLASDRLVYEPKYDGIRALVAIEPRPPASGLRPPVMVTIWSRNGHDKTAQFPDLVRAFDALAATRRAPLVLDGEIVALDARGRPASFTRLQPRIHVAGAKAIADAVRAQPVVFVAFDLLRDGDEDVRRLPHTARRLRLQRVFRPRAPSPLRLGEIVLRDGRPLLARAEREGWEGLIAKDAASSYETGRRSPAWRKLKLHKRQEFIVGGWTEGRQSRAHFGALLLGVRAKGRRPTAKGDDPLTFVGSVGTGFNAAELERVAALLKSREVKTSPFAESFKARPRGTPSMTSLEPAHWVRPELVVEVRFSEWTPDHRLRHPVYLGLRTDKKAAEVRVEDRAMGDGRWQTRPERRMRRSVVAPDFSPASGATEVARYVGRETSRAVVAPDFSPASGATQVARYAGRQAGSRDSKLTTVLDRLRALEDARKDGWLELPGGHRLHVTNLWKAFWPELRLTKGDLLRYDVEVSPFILPAVADRPLVMKRLPNGIHGKAFYQQRVLERPPAGVRVETLPEGMDPIREEEDVRNPQRFVGGSLTTLLYMAQMAAISQDPWFSTVRAPLEADQAAIDLDPGAGATWQTVLDVARWVGDELERLRIPAVPKTSGARGLHIYLPLPPGASYETGQLLCQIVATIVASKHRRHATTERRVAKRSRGTVYVDYLQNILGKTLATAYSARASGFAGVSAPLTWKEVDEGPDARAFTIRTAPARFRDVGDLWARLRTGKKVDVRAVLDRFARGPTR